MLEDEKQNKKQKTPCFAGVDDLPSRFGWLGLFTKMTIKMQQILRKVFIFCRKMKKFWKKILTYFHKFSANILDFGNKTALFIWFWQN